MPVATANISKGVVGLALALPCFFAAPFASATEGTTQYASFSQVLSAEQQLLDWRAYAHARIVPDFDWADRPAVPAQTAMQ